ncbi:MAG: putative Ig domain-containing protein [Steroidobacteraceae bacterium]|jgi:hypothetical protein|nr:putative Ig domain-containing protein [Steroidobacteraceae bacterium]
MTHPVIRATLVVLMGTWLAACGSGAPTQVNAEPGSGTGSPPTLPQTQDQPPTISLPTDSQVLVGREVVVMPVARDPEGKVLTFSIENKPAWMQFSSSTGELRGTPAPVNLGTYRDVRVTVSDGKSQASAVTTVVVVASADGRATLSWAAPVQRTDGSPLTDLAGFRIYFGNSRNDLPYVIEIKDPGARSWVVEDLTRGAWFFAATAFDRAGAESDRSNVASKSIS